MRPYLTHGFVPRERRGGDRRAGEEIARPDGNNVGGPSHATYHGLTVPRRARVIPPIIKLLSCGWHPRATRGYTRHCPLTLPLPPCSSFFSFVLPSSPAFPTAPSGCSLLVVVDPRSSIRGSDAAHVCRERSLFSRRIGIISNWLTPRIWPRFSRFSSLSLYQRFSLSAFSTFRIVES